MRLFITLFLLIYTFGVPKAQDAEVIVSARDLLANSQYSRVIKYINKTILHDSLLMKDQAVKREVILMLGEASLNRKSHESADSLFKEVLNGGASKPFTQRAYLGLARINMEKGRFTEAENYCNLLASSGYNSVELYQVMGNINSALGRFEEASQFLNRARVSFASPTDSIQAEKYLLLLYDILNNAILSGGPDIVEEEVKQIKEISKNFFQYLSVQNSLALEKVGSWRVFINDFDQAEKDLTDARSIYDSLKISKKEYITLILHQGYLNRLSGNYKSSIEYFEEAFELVPKRELRENPFYATWLSRYLVLIIATGDYEGAEPIILLTKENYVNQIKTFFPYLSEEEKERFYQDIRWRFEVFNSYAILRFTENPGISSVMYDNQIASKGIIMNETSKWKERILTSGDLQLITQYASWQEKKEALGKLYFQEERDLEQIKMLEKEVNNSERAFLSLLRLALIFVEYPSRY